MAIVIFTHPKDRSAVNVLDKFYVSLVPFDLVVVVVVFLFSKCNKHLAGCQKNLTAIKLTTCYNQRTITINYKKLRLFYITLFLNIMHGTHMSIKNIV